MFKKNDSKNSILLKSILSLGTSMGEHLEYIQKQTRQHKIPQVYKINNSKKLKKYQIIQKKLWLKNFTIDTAKIQ